MAGPRCPQNCESQAPSDALFLQSTPGQRWQSKSPYEQAQQISPVPCAGPNFSQIAHFPTPEDPASSGAPTVFRLGSQSRASRPGQPYSLCAWILVRTGLGPCRYQIWTWRQLTTKQRRWASHPSLGTEASEGCRDSGIRAQTYCLMNLGFYACSCRGELDYDLLIFLDQPSKPEPSNAGAGCRQVRNGSPERSRSVHV